jgi:xanthine dehydrogenase accessory factor
MKELQEIVRAFEDANKKGMKAALATVVHVVGSAYRHEGARMLVTENGELTGAISGGCLEGDALRKARLAMAENRNMLVTYDTTDEDDATLGVGLGCNGVIQVLLEPINAQDELNPINLFKTFLATRQKAVLGTFFSLRDKFSAQPGTSVLITENIVSGSIDSSIETEFQNDAKKVLASGQSLIQTYTGSLSGFVELLKPPVQLLVFGAGNDAIPVAQLAGILGWETTIIDGRSNYATATRFPSVNRLVVARPDTALESLELDDWTVAVLMTHNYNYDLAILKQLLNIEIKYIGALGPRKKLERMLDELREEHLEIAPEKLNTVFGPTGLDIGSETPEEIALSIISEIKAVLSNREGTSLRFKTPEHNQNQPVSKKHSNAKFASCTINL